MDKIKFEEVKKELTMILMYLSRFTPTDRFSDGKSLLAWEGYDFGVINKLDDDDFIRQGSNLSRTRYVAITDSGIE